jgi:hypothetical protein
VCPASIYFTKLLNFVNFCTHTIMKLIRQCLFILYFFRMTPYNLYSWWCARNMHKLSHCQWVLIKLINHFSLYAIILFLFSICLRCQSPAHASPWLSSSSDSCLSLRFQVSCFTFCRKRVEFKICSSTSHRPQMLCWSSRSQRLSWLVICW